MVFRKWVCLSIFQWKKGYNLYKIPVFQFVRSFHCCVPKAGMLYGVLNALILILYLIGWLLCQWQQLGWQIRDELGFSQPQRLSHTWDKEKKTFAWPFLYDNNVKTIYKPFKLDLWVNNLLIVIIKIREMPSNNKIEHSVAMFALIKFF